MALVSSQNLKMWHHSETEPGVGSHACNPSIREVGDQEFKASLAYTVSSNEITALRMDYEAIAAGLDQERSPDTKQGGHEVMEMKSDAANSHDA